ncbi:hypothetical protein NA78x_001351 [Anatilimnocola sp. NA78]|uniref:hypothetical protein n=1 Tax=Anatilimnocola sp. NA78 TaxID=3415683 RepID=UPI003CE53A5D
MREQSVSLHIRVAPEEVTLWHFPLRDRGLGAWLAMLVPLLAGLLVAWRFDQWWAGVLVGLVGYAAIWRNWLPVQISLGATGIKERCLGFERRIGWTAIRSYEVRRFGLLLLPDDRLTRVAPLRGLYLHWGRQKGEVLAVVEYYLQAWAGAAPPSTHIMQRLVR